jgi:HSP20 family protein
MNIITKFNAFDPFNDLGTLKTQFDRLIARLNPDRDELLVDEWSPLADVFETPDAIKIKVELPGMTEKDIHVEMENGVLMIRGERKFEKETTDKGYRRVERAYGKFVRSFMLPVNVDFGKISAAYNNGMLDIEVPKKEEAKPKTINVEVRKKLAHAA